VEVCDYILSERIQEDADIYYPLVTAISVLYARPFKRSKGIEPLNHVQFVPKKFHPLHHQLIVLRDKASTHVDARSVFFRGDPANNVILSVREHGTRMRLAVQRVKFKTVVISQIRDLAIAMVKRMLDYIRNITAEHPNDFPDDGDYLIDLTTGTFRHPRNL
jgi:hypothetical protein